jgi:signal transduction histidine kinase
MLNTETLRGRLSLSYASALIVALVAFAVIALLVVDGAQRLALDGQLESTARALQIVGDVHGDKLTLDAGDRRQFAMIVGAKAESAIITAGTVAIGSDEATAAALSGFANGANAPSYATETIAGRDLRVFVFPIVAKGVRVGAALTWSDLRAIGAVDRSVALGFALAIPLIAILAMLAGGEIARRGLTPLDRIATLASEIEAYDLARRLALPERNDELGKLAATFDRMLDRLQSAFDRERRFTSDASHELRAPLSVIRAEADLALRGERTASEYRQALETIAEEADALEALTRDLLAAARNDRKVANGQAPVDLSLVASAVAKRMSVLAGGERVVVNRVSQEDAIVNVDRTLIERAVVSVVHNALKYSPEAGRVEIRISGMTPACELAIHDEGPGFSETALSRGFDRFWRDDAARGREGSGLGLSLAKTIVEGCGGTIALANAQPHGAIVRMTFPPA